MEDSQEMRDFENAILEIFGHKYSLAASLHLLMPRFCQFRQFGDLAPLAGARSPIWRKNNVWLKMLRIAQFLEKCKKKFLKFFGLRSEVARYGLFEAL